MQLVLVEKTRLAVRGMELDPYSYPDCIGQQAIGLAVGRQGGRWRARRVSERGSELWCLPWMLRKSLRLRLQVETETGESREPVMGDYVAVRGKGCDSGLNWEGSERGAQHAILLDSQYRCLWSRSPQ